MKKELEESINYNNSSSCCGDYQDFCYSFLSDVGRQREKNEDSLFVDATRGLFIIADGLGGYPGGEIASQLTVNLVSGLLKEQIDSLLSSSSPSIFLKEEVIYRIIRYTLHIVDKKIIQEGQRNKEVTGLGTTVVLVFLASPHA